MSWFTATAVNPTRQRLRLIDVGVRTNAGATGIGDSAPRRMLAGVLVGTTRPDTASIGPVIAPAVAGGRATLRTN